jgi:hypothetical protein
MVQEPAAKAKPTDAGADKVWALQRKFPKHSKGIMLEYLEKAKKDARVLPMSVVNTENTLSHLLPPYVAAPLPLRGGTFGSPGTKSTVEWTIDLSRDKPGPGRYNPDSTVTSNFYQVTGGRISSSKVPSDVDWSMQRAKMIPGPGEYQVRKHTPLLLPGGKFNMSNPKSDLDLVILKSGKIPSSQDYLTDGSHTRAKTKGGAWGKETIKWVGGNNLDCVIRIAKEVPGPGEYNAELNELSTRTNSRVYVPSESSIPPKERPKSGLARFGPGIPPEARRKPRPKEVHENSSQSHHSIRNNRPRTPSTTLGSIGYRNHTPTARWLSHLSQKAS